MYHLRHPLGFCDCGQAIEFRHAAGSGSHREISCACGRRHDVELGVGGWTVVAQVTPERSLPLSGFSTALRHSPDAERFWFLFSLRGDVAMPAHILFSPSARKAEIKAGDLKVFAVDGVRLPTEARRRWITWWQARRPASRNRGLSFQAPCRVGRLPAALVQRRPPGLSVR
jgi:hypothetical protein